MFLVALLGSAMGSPAAAQQGDPPPIYRHIDENGVNLVTGDIRLDDAILTVGKDNGKLTLRLLGNAAGVWLNFQGRAVVEDDGEGDWYAEVYFEDDRNTFPGAGPSWPGSEQGDGATLSATSNSFVWTRSDGTVVTFNRTFGGGGVSYGVPTEIAYPNGHKIRIYYKAAGAIQRVQSVTSNFGWQLKFNYPSSSSQTASSVQAINNAIDYCDPTADSCTGLSRTWPTVQISQTNESGSGPNVVTLTNPLNQTRRYSFQAPIAPQVGVYWLSGIKEEGRATDNITFAYSPMSITRDGVTYTYSNGYYGPQQVYEITRSGPLGQILAAGRTPNGDRLAYVRDGLNRTTQFTYDSMMRLARITEPEGNYTQYSYDSRGNITETRRVGKAGSGVADIVTGSTYSLTCANPRICNKPLTSSDASARVTEYSYDATTGQILTALLPAPVSGAVRPQIRYGYTPYQAYLKNSSGAVVASGEPISLQTNVSACRTAASCVGTADEVKQTITYGPQTAGIANNLLPATTSVGSGDGALTATSTFGYDATGNVTSVDGPLGGTSDTTQYRYDAGQRMIGVIGPDPDGTGALKNRARRLTYNGANQVTAIETAALNGQSDTDWNSFVPLERMETDYDSNGRRTVDRLVAGGATQMLVQHSYDAAGRLECSALRMNPAAFASLPASACTLGSEGTFGPDRITWKSYDAAGQVLEIRRGYGTSAAVLESSTYTPNGKVQSVTDGSLNKTLFEYDGHDRLAKIRYPVAAKGAGEASTTDYEQYGYDIDSNATSLRLRDGSTVAFAFDAFGRLTGKVRPNGEAAAAYTYDNLGHMTSVTDFGQTLSFGWDALGRRVSETSDLGTMASTWDLAGRRTRLQHPDGFFVDYDYLVTGELLRVRENGATSGSGVLATYGYDDRGRRISVSRGNGTVTSYDYDAASRLRQTVDDLAGSAYDRTVTLADNPAGQTIQSVRSNDSYAWGGAYAVSRAYTSNGLNQYTMSGPIVPTYDPRGNLLSAGSTTYGYNSDNLLVTTGGQEVARYDGLLRLTRIGVSGSPITRFGYDGPNIAAEYSGTSGALLRRYVSGQGPDEQIAWYEGTGTADRRFFHTDERGSIVAVSDSSGAALAINSYDEFGIPGATNLGRLQYTGQTWLPELGLYSFKARLYSPTLGRFLQTDPIGYGAGPNLYAYAGNDPIGKVDPTGLQEVEVMASIVVTGTRSGTHCDMQGVTGGCIDSSLLPSGEDRFAFLETEKGDPVAPRHKPPSVCPAVPASRPVGTHGQKYMVVHDPVGAQKADVVRDFANEQSQRRFPNLSGHNDIRDAYRHFLWVYGMSRVMGTDRARRFANAHEANYENNPADEQDMDTYNNEVAMAMYNDPRYAGMSTAQVAEIAVSNHCLRTLR